MFQREKAYTVISNEFGVVYLAALREFGSIEPHVVLPVCSVCSRDAHADESTPLGTMHLEYSTSLHVEMCTVDLVILMVP